MAFPTSVTAFPATTGTEVLGLMGSGVGLSGMINNMGTDITALENKVGTGATVPAANQLLFGTGAGTSAWQALTSAQLAAVVSDETGSGSLVFGSSPTIVTPTIASFTNAQHDHSNAAGGGTISQAGMPLGSIVQVVNLTSSTSTTGTTILPYDNTIPQNTEGDQYMSLSITPKAVTNILVIVATSYTASNQPNSHNSIGLFQDSTASALAATSGFMATTSGEINNVLTYTMAAGTTSATTFKIRAGSNIAGTTTFNGAAGAGIFSTAVKSSMIIYEYRA